MDTPRLKTFVRGYRAGLERSDAWSVGDLAIAGGVAAFFAVWGLFGFGWACAAVAGLCFFVASAKITFGL